MATRTFKVTHPHMQGGDILNWQKDLHTLARELKLPEPPLVVDGDFGPVSRSISAALCHALGIHVQETMKKGVTPTLRRRMRARDLTPAEKKRFNSTKYKKYRTELRKRWHFSGLRVHKPVSKILADSWGYHPGIHDGVDVICLPDVPIFAMIKAKVIDVRSSGWWGLGAPSNPAVRAKGDGIIQLEVLESIGPFVKGAHIGYGHAEKAVVKVGQVVEAGHVLGHAGLANAWHVHLMYNDGSQGTRGIGNINPQQILDYTIKHG